MSDKKLNKIAAYEKAIAEKYGEDTVKNPRSNWDEEKETEYLIQMKELYKKVAINNTFHEKVDVNGIKVSKKLFNRDSLEHCPVCFSFMKKTADDVCLIKYECCHKCYVQHVEGRLTRWENGWRPQNENN